MKKTKLSVGEKIRQLRIDHSMTQEDLSKELMVTRQTVSSWERNQSIPDILMLQMISKYFGVSNEYLLSDGYSRLKELLLRYNILLIIAATAFFTLIGILVHNHYDRVYDYRLEPYKGVCIEHETSSSVREKHDGFILVVDEFVDVELAGNEYCFPLTFIFESSTRRENDYFHIEKITPPHGAEVTDFTVEFTRISDNKFLFEYKVYLNVVDDNEEELENIVEAEKIVELEIPFE